MQRARRTKRYVLNSCLLHLKNNTLRVVSTDGFMLAYAQIEAPRRPGSQGASSPDQGLRDLMATLGAQDTEVTLLILMTTFR